MRRRCDGTDPRASSAVLCDCAEPARAGETGSGREAVSARRRTVVIPGVWAGQVLAYGGDEVRRTNLPMAVAEDDGAHSRAGAVARGQR